MSTGQTHSRRLTAINRNSYFAPSTVNASRPVGKDDAPGRTSRATLSVDLDLNAKNDDEQEEKHDNTASYKKVRDLIFGQAMRYVCLSLS